MPNAMSSALVSWPVKPIDRIDWESDKWAEFTTAIVTASSGIYKLSLTDTQTKAIDAGIYVNDVMITLVDSTIEVVHSGIITVNPRATKA